MSSLLATGGAGFIGANFVRHWRGRNPSDIIVVLDALTHAGNAGNIDGVASVIFVKGSINDLDLVEQLLAEHSVDRRVHFAAESHVDHSMNGSAFMNATMAASPIG